MMPVMPSTAAMNGGIPYRLASPSAMGATMAVAAAGRVPIAVRTAPIRNGTRATSNARPPTRRSIPSSSQSSVPLICATAKSAVIPTSRTKKSPGKKAVTSSAVRSAASPTRKAAGSAVRPMLNLGTAVAAKRATRTMMETSAMDIGGS